MSKPAVPDRHPAKCAYCSASATPEHAPFCSQGCRDRDLLQWLDEGYRIPGRPADPQGHEIDIDGLDSEA